MSKKTILLLCLAIVVTLIFGSLMSRTTKPGENKSAQQKQGQVNFVGQDKTEKSDSQVPVLTIDITLGYSSEIIQVKFKEGTDVDPPTDPLTPDLLNSVDSITRLFTLSEEQLGKIGAGRLNLWFKITLKPGIDAADFIEDLKLLDSVEVAEPAPLPAPPP